MGGGGRDCIYVGDGQCPGSVKVFGADFGSPLTFANPLSLSEGEASPMERLVRVDDPLLISPTCNRQLGRSVLCRLWGDFEAHTTVCSVLIGPWAIFLGPFWHRAVFRYWQCAMCRCFCGIPAVTLVKTGPMGWGVRMDDPLLPSPTCN